MNELNIAKIIVQKRKEKEITQDELANYIGVSKASVSKWETGQSYPDILLLPQLAAYFNISVDELIDYKPQMIKEDIRKLYLRLAKDFTEKPFEDVMSVVRETTKKYFSCFPLLFHMGTLMLNHHSLASEENRQFIIGEALNLFVRVKSESTDIALSKQANVMEATCYILLSEPTNVIDLLDDSNTPALNESNLLSISYSMNNQPDKANEVLQIGIYQDLLSVLQNLLSLLQLEAVNNDKADEIILRLISLADTFNIEELHPTTMLSVYILSAQVYVMHGSIETALSTLQKYCDLAVNIDYPITLHGDNFFNKISSWLSELDLGVDVPRHDKAVKQNIIDGVASNPAFAVLSDNFKYKSIVEKLTTVLGG